MPAGACLQGRLALPGNPMLSGTELIVALVAVAAGATVMGSVGFGLGLVVTPILLLLLEPQTVVVLVNGEIVFLTMLLLIRTWRHMRWKPSLLMSAAGVAASPVGVLLLDSAAPSFLRLAVAAAVLMLGVLIISNYQPPWARHPLAGAASGFTAALSITALSIGGPLAAYYAIAQDWDPKAVRACLALYFLTFELAAFALYVWTGLAHRDSFVNIGMLLPAVLLGFALGSLAASRLDHRAFRRAAVGVIIAGGLSLLGREVAGL